MISLILNLALILGSIHSNSYAYLADLVELAPELALQPHRSGIDSIFTQD
jgi:hypothetical protein